MSFRFVQVLFFVGLMLGCLSLAQGQPAGPAHNSGSEQPIVFSSPDGESISNALLPAAHAPSPMEWQDYPGAAPDSFDAPQLPGPSFPRQTPVLPPDEKDQGLTEDGKHVRLKTSAEIMGIPTLQEIFGLPKPDPSDQKDESQQDTATNTIDSYGSSPDGSSSQDSRWEKILSGNADRYAFGADKAKSATNMLGGYFSNTPGNNFFASHEKEWDEAAFGSTPLDQTLTQPPQPDSSAPATPVDGPGFTQGISPVNSPFGSGLNSQSPFDLPKSSVPQAAPQLPALPGVMGQNIAPARPITPLWGPKPAPWLSPVPQMGIAEQHPF